MPRQAAERVRQAWDGNRDLVLRFAIILMSLAALVWLSYEFWRLLFQTGYWGAIDLRTHRNFAIAWFQGVDIYARASLQTYSPASQPMIWLFLGWLDESSARWLWGIMSLVAIGALVYLCLHAVAPKTRLETIFIGLIPLSIYPVGAATGNGQFIGVILPLLITGILYLNRPFPHQRAELIAAACILFSLLKPTVSAPFFWLVLFGRMGWRPALLVLAGYCGLTLFAAMYQTTPLFVLLREWLSTNEAATNYYSISNVNAWFATWGWQAWSLPAAGILVGILGIWVWLHRGGDIWILLGVTAIVARIAAYHSWYDDALLLLPLLALYRIAKNTPVEGTHVVAGILFGANLVFMQAPGGLYLLPPPFNSIYLAIQFYLWLGALFFLMYTAHKTNWNGKLTNAFG